MVTRISTLRVRMHASSSELNVLVMYRPTLHVVSRKVSLLVRVIWLCGKRFQDFDDPDLLSCAPFWCEGTSPHVQSILLSSPRATSRRLLHAGVYTTLETFFRWHSDIHKTRAVGRKRPGIGYENHWRVEVT